MSLPTLKQFRSLTEDITDKTNQIDDIVQELFIRIEELENEEETLKETIGQMQDKIVELESQLKKEGGL